jgi:hypothetical protein
VTANKIEEVLFAHTTGIATLEESMKNQRERLIEVTKTNEDTANRWREEFERQKIEISDLTLKLALVGKETADLKNTNERGRAIRTSLVVSLIGTAVSVIGSALITLFLKPK